MSEIKRYRPRSAGEIAFEWCGPANEKTRIERSIHGVPVVRECQNGEYVLFGAVTMMEQALAEKDRRITELEAEQNNFWKRVQQAENTSAMLVTELSRRDERIADLEAENSALRSHHHDAELAFDLHAKSQTRIKELEAKLAKYREATGSALEWIESDDIRPQDVLDKLHAALDFDKAARGEDCDVREH